MTFTFKTLALVASIGLGVGLLLPSIGRSQINSGPAASGRVHIPRDNSPLQSPSINSPVKPSKYLLSDTEKLELRVAELEAKLETQQKSFETKLAAQQKSIDEMGKTVYGRPQGYTKAFITIGNFHRLPDTDAISYWARN